MRYSACLIALVSTFALSVSVMAAEKEVYKSVDKQGEVKFTDQASAGAEVVDIENPNIADSVPDAPRQSKPEIKKVSKGGEPDQPKTVYRSYDDDEKNPKRVHREQQRQERRDERHEAREGQGNGSHPKQGEGQAKAHKQGASHHGGAR